MKKTLIAVAAMAATGAFAQVTVYGRVDAGFQQNTTTAAGVETKNSGIFGGAYNSNLWGIKATDDLGSGMKANVQLEAGFDPATGEDSKTQDTTFNATTGQYNKVGTGFNRISTVGLSGNFGTVDLGRYYTPTFLTVGSIDPFATTGATATNLYPEDVRVSNAIHYVSPNFSGLSIRVMHNANGSKSAANPISMGFSVTYAQGPFMVAAASGTIDVGATNKQEGTAFVAQYDMKVVKLGLGVTTAKATNGSEATETNLNLTAPFGKTTLLASYGMNKVKAGTAEDDGSDFVIGATYALSARTALYAKTGSYNVLDKSKNKSETLAIGLKTAF